MQPKPEEVVWIRPELAADQHRLGVRGLCWRQRFVEERCSAQPRRHDCTDDVGFESPGLGCRPRLHHRAGTWGDVRGSARVSALQEAVRDNTNTGGLFYTSASVPSIWWNILSETIATFVLVYWVLASSPFVPGTGDSAPEFGNAALGYAGVAFTVIAVGASLGGATGYAINPARDFGPRFVYWLLPMKGKGSSNWCYAWIAILGPLLGGAIAAELFNLMN